MLEIIFVVFQDSRNLPCETDGKNPGKDIGSKGIGAFWPWRGPNIGQNGVIKWRFFESFAKILHCVCTRIASRQILFCPIPIPTSERPFMDTRTKNTIKNWVCTYIRMSTVKPKLFGIQIRWYQTVSAKLSRPTGQKISKVRKQQKTISILPILFLCQ